MSINNRLDIGKVSLFSQNECGYKLAGIHPTDEYCTDRKLGEDIVELFDELRVPYSFTVMILG